MKTILDEGTKISLSLKAAYALGSSLIFAGVCLAGVYAQTRDLPERVTKIEQALESRNTRDQMTCKVLLRIQNQVVPAVYREDMNCQ